MDALTDSNSPKAKLDEFRKEFLDELPNLAREMIDTARAEGTTAAYEKVMNTAMKVVEGVQVDVKKDQYANLPVIHVSFGPGMQMATTITPAAPVVELAGDEVVDVEPRQPASPFRTSASQAFGTAPALPDDPLDLLAEPTADPVRTQDEDAVLEALTMAGSALALD